MMGRASLEMLLGRIRRSVELYGVALYDIEALMETVARDPALNLGLFDERVRKLELLRKALGKGCR